MKFQFSHKTKVLYYFCTFSFWANSGLFGLNPHQRVCAFTLTKSPSALRKGVLSHNSCLIFNTISLPAYEEDSLDKSQFEWMKWLLCCSADLRHRVQRGCVCVSLAQCCLCNRVSESSPTKHPAICPSPITQERHAGVCSRVLFPVWSSARVGGVRAPRSLWEERVVAWEGEDVCERRRPWVCYYFGCSAVTSSRPRVWCVEEYRAAQQPDTRGEHQLHSSWPDVAPWWPQGRRAWRRKKPVLQQ